MKIGLLTDSLGAMPIDEVLQVAAQAGVRTVEFACGNWSSAPHIELDAMLQSQDKRRAFVAKLRDHGLTISALNCSGNPLHPGATGKQHHAVVEKTIELARLLEVERVVMMSGLPGAPGDSHPNWIITDWPPECMSILEYQWSDVIIPYWKKLVTFANGHGIRKLCLELHGHQAVYNPASLPDCATRSARRSASTTTRAIRCGWAPIRWRRFASLAARSIMCTPRTRALSRVAGVDGLLDARSPNRVSERAGTTSRWATATTCCGGSSSASSSARRLRRRAVDRARGHGDDAARRRPQVGAPAARGRVQSRGVTVAAESLIAAPSRFRAFRVLSESRHGRA